MIARALTSEGGTWPAPDGRHLDIALTCTSDPAASTGALHHIVIRSDWTVQTPHDLDSERVARSFGGWCTCLAFAEQVLPAFRHTLAVMDYQDSDIDRISAERMLAETDRTPRSDEVVAVHRRLFRELFTRAGHAWAQAGDTRQVDGGIDGFVELWNHGFSPARVDRLARALHRVTWPLPTSFFLRTACDDADLDFLACIFGAYPEREFVVWATARLHGYSRVKPEIVWRMYELGLSASDAVGVLSESVDVTRITRFAQEYGVEPSTAARWLTLCSRIGVTPSAAHLRLLETHGVLQQPPPPWAYDWMIDALRDAVSTTDTRTELAVVLMLVGEPGLASRAISTGIRTPSDERLTSLIARRKST